MGIRVADLFPSSGKQAKAPLRLAELASAKKFPVEWLRDHGVADLANGSGVGIGYFHEDGRQAERSRKRTALKAKDGSSWLGPKGVPPIPYGVNLLENARAKRELFIVEGETDCWALWFHGYPALGMPGAKNIKGLTLNHLREIERVYVVEEPDLAGAAFPGLVTQQIRKLGYSGEVRAIRMPAGAKDPCDLHVAGNFENAFTEALKAANPVSDIQLKDTLLSAVRIAALDKELTGFDRKRTIAKLIRDAMLNDGHLCCTADSQLFYFRRSERKLYNLDTREFCHLITTESGLSASETYFQFTLDALQAEAARLAPSAVHTLGHYDATTGRITVSDGGPGVWVRERHGEWIRSHNGADGLLFFTERDAEPWEPDFSKADGSMAWFLGQFSFADHDPLSATDSASLFLVALLQQFFPSLRRTRILPTWLGPQGSGKSTNMRLTGRLLVGSAFDVTGVRKEKEDAFVAGVTNRTVQALDNADSKIDWLEDCLATYATGLRHQLRRLYSTNEEISYRPRAFLMLSSRDAHFRRADVAERLLLLHCKRPDAYLSEDSIFGEVERRRGAVMADVLRLIAQAADAQQVAAPPMQFRMADYASFGWKLFHGRGRGTEWMDLLKRLERTQIEFAGAGDGLVETLRLLLERNDGAIRRMESAALFDACNKIAAERGLWLPRSASGFGQKLTLMARIIEAELDVKFTDSREHARSRIITIEPRQVGRVDSADEEVRTHSQLSGGDII
jgi:hypothetical protein